MAFLKWTSATAILALAASAAMAMGRKVMTQAVPIRIEFKADGAHDVDIEAIGPDAWEIRTTGGDPYVLTKPFPEPVEARRHPVLAFEYFCPSGIDSFQVFLGPAFSEKRSVRAGKLGVAEGWIKHSVDLSQTPAWTGTVPSLRLDFGRIAGRTIRIRNIVLRPYNAREIALAASRAEREAAKKRLAADLARYLAADFPCRVTRVSVGPDDLTVRWDLGGRDPRSIVLCEVPAWQNVTETGKFIFETPLPERESSITLPRFSDAGGLRHDRLLSAWVLAEKGGGDRRRLVSHARYADDDAIRGARNLPPPRPRSRKGLGGFDPARCGNGADADALGIGYATVNIVLSFMRPGPAKDTMPFEYCGRTYYAARPMIERYDRVARFCAERNIVVSAIILVPKPRGFAGDLGRYFTHPEYDEHGIFAMPNFTTAEAVNYYAAAMQFLAERYSREDGRFGRIHYWIMHNEVDAGWVWTNAGRQPLHNYLNMYHKSMRIGHLIARQYDRNARAFISLTHHWTYTEDPHFYLPKELLEIFARWSAAEGDFEWGIAYHPYPQSLWNPRSWEDRKVDFTFNTPLITFKNIEVLDAWVRQPFMKFRGTVLRKLHLSEQGPNSPDYSEKSLRDQAACMAYAWKKIEVLDTIEAFQYHNWIDNRHEGGLRLGLRMFPGKEYKCTPKPIWYVYKALDTPEEDAACEFAKKVIGIRDWSEVRHTGPIR